MRNRVEAQIRKRVVPLNWKRGVPQMRTRIIRIDINKTTKYSLTT